MVVRFGSNILSLNVQRQLGRATADLSAVSQRLASGQRINRASDDAAGLAISTTLKANSRIYAQGIRNLNDGISQSNIAESAMASLTLITDRIQELATQAMSSTYGDKQRQSMQQEVTALQSEWNRIVESTSFNGTNLLTGNNTRTVLQGGRGVEGTLAVQFGEAQLAGGLEGYGGRGTTRISTDSAGNQITADGAIPTAISADGRFVAFYSGADNLVEGDTNGTTDAFIKDTVTGVTTRVSTDSAGNQSTGSSIVAAISADGRYVAFYSAASDLVAGDTNGQSDSFIKDTVTGVTTRVSTDSAGSEASGASFVTAISADGRFVAFNSSASNLVAGDTNNQVDSFIKDTVTGITTRVSTDSAGNQAIGANSSVNAISADGRYVAFRSSASNLVAGDTNGLTDSFIKDTLTGVTTRISTDSAGNQATGESFVAAISADGRFVAFYSSASDLVAGDTNGVVDSFIKDTVTGVTTRITTDSSGNEATGGDSVVTGISADGRFVVFSSEADNLVAGDTNLVSDGFIKDTLTGITTRLSIDSAGNEADGASGAGPISADGRFVAILSEATNLVEGDTNGEFDSFVRDLTRTGVQTMSGMVVSNRASAGVTLNLVQRYRDELTSYRSNLGATTSRIAAFTSTLQSARINTLAADSRIADADIAQDAARAVAATIRQQVAASLLGQANLEPQIGLRLLQNI
jgi:flagellin-like hook-associated protein FlgL